MPAFHLAHANIARMRAPLEDPSMAGFVDRLDPLNEIADDSPGFVWRYETPDDDTKEAEVFGDERILFNMSLWESFDLLEEYAYRSKHLEAVQRRGEWFERPDRTPLVLWWVEAGYRPSIEEAKARFDRLWADGPSEYAFTFRQRYSMPQGVT